MQQQWSHYMFWDGGTWKISRWRRRSGTCLLQKQKVYRETSRIPEHFQKKTAKSVFAKPRLKSAGHEEEYFRVCTGTVTVILWTPFVLSALLPTRHASKCTLLPQKHSFSSTVLQRKTTPHSGYPSLHFWSHLPVRSRCPPSTLTGLGLASVSPVEGEKRRHRSQEPTALLHPLQAFQHRCDGDKCCHAFPLHPML